MLNRQGRPTTPGHGSTAAHATFTGNKGLQQEEGLIFEIGRLDTTGVDLPVPKPVKSRLGSHTRKGEIGLPGLSEPETMRHYVRLSQKNYGIDTGLFSLGSCTMKHNPRLNEKMARLPGFGDIHPLQPISTVQGALKLMEELAHWLVTLTGMQAVAMSPKAGAHGELCGMIAIKAAIAAKGEAETRKVVLVPESAHGTNPATAALIGFEVKSVPAQADGTVHVGDVKALLGPDVAAIMLTNPNTCGIFEPEIVEIAAAMHAAGAYFYCDGANFNAIVGKVRPGDLGVDAMHINLTRPSRHPMVAADRVQDRLCSPSGWRPSHPCPSCALAAAGSRWSRMSRMHKRASIPLAGSPPSMARWACMCGRLPTCSAMVPMAAVRLRKMLCSTQTTSAPGLRM